MPIKKRHICEYQAWHRPKSVQGLSAHHRRTFGLGRSKSQVLDQQWRRLSIRASGCVFQVTNISASEPKKSFPTSSIVQPNTVQGVRPRKTQRRETASLFSLRHLKCQLSHITP